LNRSDIDYALDTILDTETDTISNR